MGYYRFCDTTVESALELPELMEVPAAPPGMRVTVVGDDEEGGGQAAPAFHRWELPGGETWAEFRREGASVRISFPLVCEFVLVGDTGEIRCRPQDEAPAASVRHVLVNQVLPLVLAHQGRFVLHASAVATPRGAVGFAGETGRGKSTVAASFWRSGFPLVTDDCLLLDERDGRLVAIPSYGSVRLWDDSLEGVFGAGEPAVPIAPYTTKKRVAGKASGAFSPEAVPFRYLYVLGAEEQEGGGVPFPQLRETATPLGRGGGTAAGPPPAAEPARSSRRTGPPPEHAGVQIVPMTPAEAFVRLVALAFKLEIDDPDRLRQEFERLGRLSTQPIFFSLRFPRDYALLPSVRRAVLAHAGIDTEA